MGWEEAQVLEFGEEKSGTGTVTVTGTEEHRVCFVPVTVTVPVPEGLSWRNSRTLPSKSDRQERQGVTAKDAKNAKF